MKVEKIFRKDDGTRYRIAMSIATDSFRDSVYVKVDAWKAEPGKRKFVPLSGTDDAAMNRLRLEDRDTVRKDIIKREIPAEWVDAARKCLVDALDDAIAQAWRY